jgi:hypothetical protein
VVALRRAAAARGAAVVLATPDPQAAEACDGELHLDDGVPTWVRELGPPADLDPDPNSDSDSDSASDADQDQSPHGRHRAG